MSDLISRQAAIDALCKSECGCSNAECRHKDDADFCVTCDSVNIIKSLPSVQPETNCSEIPNNSDTISRQQAIDVLHGYFDGMLETDTVCPADIYGLFECMPSVQPEIIYCKDCKFYTAYDYTGKLMCKRIGKGMILPKPEDYCSYAERITDGRPN